MPNYVDNRLAISVPADRAADLMAALEGPAQWPVPAGLLPAFGRKADLSQHERIRVAAMIADGTALAAFEAERARLGWPDWMKPTRHEIEALVAGETLDAPETVPLSFPRLAPWTGPEEFFRVFPDATPNDAVHIAPEKPRGFDLSAFQSGRMGTSRTPGDFDVVTADEEDGRITIAIRFQTGWSGVDRIAALLEEVMAAHGAKFLYTWVEEQGYCGYVYRDPAGDLFQAEEFDAENRWQVEESFEDEPDEIYHRFDREAFENEIADIVDDAHL